MAFQNRPGPPNLQSLNGLLERITYHDQQSGYTVAKVKVKGRPDLLTVVGHMIQANPGAVLAMTGAWETHPKFGRQFRLASCRVSTPADEYGIRKYLGSGLIKGLGPEMARRIVKHFGRETLKVIEQNPRRLLEVEGIGPKRLAMLEQAWQAQKQIRQVMIFLQSHDISSTYAVRIYKTYGDQAVEMVTENPYRLATDIWGIGFKSADKIAARLGFEPHHPMRIAAGTLYVLNQAANEGHCFLPYRELVTRCRNILDVPGETVRQAVADLAAAKQIVIEDINSSVDDFKPDTKAVYPAALHTCESGIAARLAKLNSFARRPPTPDVSAAVAKVEKRLGIRLASNQRRAVEAALEAKPLVITGGPGTGKTTLIKAIIELYRKAARKVILAAPTGRAAKRMAEATGHGAKTIHRLLGYKPGQGFKKNGRNQLDCDLLVVDETSMIDTILMHHLLKAVPISGSLILVGDVHQLPSVGAGNVLRDIISSGMLTVVRLDQIFRQALKSRIVTNAHRILDGRMPRDNPPKHGKSLSDYYFIRKKEPEEIIQTMLTLVAGRIPQSFGLSPLDHIQVLTPMHRGSLGAANLNRLLQARLNPAMDFLEHGGRRFAAGDRVMQLRNDYDKSVFNGDIGFIAGIDRMLRRVLISFDQRSVEYDFSELDQLSLAYAVSIHKSQGSEYPAVVIPVTTQHYVMLQRNLIYTALTRASRLAVLVGTKQALAIAVRNNKPQKRYTGLCSKLNMLSARSKNAPGQNPGNCIAP